MKNKFFKRGAVALTVAAMVMSMSCKDKDKEPEIIPDPVLSITPDVTDIVFAVSGETATSGGQTLPSLTFKVETNQQSWTVTPSHDWVTIEESGDFFTLSAEEAGWTAPPQATITVKAGAATDVVINVTQMAKSPTLIVEPLAVRNVTFSAYGETTVSEFTVTTNVDDWNAEVTSEDSEWLTVDVDKTAKTFVLSVEDNKTGAEREATVTVTAGTAEQVTIHVTQTAETFGSELVNAEMPFAHKEPAITDQGDKWNYDVDGGWRYNEAGGANGVVFYTNATYNYTLSLSAWSVSAFPSPSIVNGKLYQTLQLEPGTYRFTAYVLAVWGGAGSNAYVVAASGTDLPDLSAVGNALQSAALPKTDGESFPPVFVDFTLTESGVVSLGFVGSFANAEIHFSKVELIKDPPYELSVTPGTATFIKDGTNPTTFTVTTGAPSWNADVTSANSNWLTVTGKTGDTFTLTATENNTGAERSATVTVTAGNAEPVTLNVRQLDDNPSVFDDFNRTSIGDDWIFNATLWRLNNNMIEGTSNGTVVNFMLHTKTLCIGNFSVAADIVINATASGAWAGLVFNYIDDNNFYVFRITPRAMQLYYMENGAFTEYTSWELDGTLVGYQWYHVEVSTETDNFRIKVTEIGTDSLLYDSEEDDDIIIKDAGKGILWNNGGKAGLYFGSSCILDNFVFSEVE